MFKQAGVKTMNLGERHVRRGADKRGAYRGELKIGKPFYMKLIAVS